MVLILPEYSQRPYRYGMTLLCIGAMFNWLGLAENNAEPVRYIGVTLIAAGAMLICLAMCFWMKASHEPPSDSSQSEEPVHHIVTIHQSGAPLEKPPDYDSVTGCLPPCYEDAIRLNPSLLLPNISSAQDMTDSRKQDTIIQATGIPRSSNDIPAPPYCQTCPITIDHDSALIKTEDVIVSPKITPNEAVVITNDVSTVSNAVDGSSQNDSQSNDNFGSRVLRLSKRLLRGRQTRANSQDGESSGNSNTTVPQQPSAVAGTLPTELPQRVTSTEIDITSSSPSTSSLPVR